MEVEFFYMLITKTPFRISFFGGGSDYPAWYREFGGSTLVSTINRYCYLTCRYLPPFFEHRHRIVYSKIELVDEISQIQHPSVKGVLTDLKINKGVEVIHYGDLPARTGLGSSSSFTVGLIKALGHLEGKNYTKDELAMKAIHIEQNVMKEVVGSQDQAAAAYGGLNRIFFNQDDTITVKPLLLSQERIQKLQSQLFIVFTGVQRNAPDIAKAQVENLKHHKSEVFGLLHLVDESEKLLSSENTHLDEFGKLLKEGWKLKRQLSDRITNPKLDEIYEKGLECGALGGKLLGAGGGGFFLFYVPENEQKKFVLKMHKFVICPVEFEFQGSQLLTMSHSDPETI